MLENDDDDDALLWWAFPQGEEQKKLDILSNEVFVNALVSSGRTV
jgi:fructose-1,6-bisphosphatase